MILFSSSSSPASAFRTEPRVRDDQLTLLRPSAFWLCMSLVILVLFLGSLVSPQVEALESKATDPGSDPGEVEARPILTCVVQHDDSHFTAVFGYENDSAKSISIPIGVNNRFTTAPENQGQPTSFRPGTHPGVFDVNFSEELVWKLGKDVAIALPQSSRCPLECPPDQAADLQGQCLPIEQDTDRVVKEDDVRDTGPDFESPEDAAGFILDTVLSMRLGDAAAVTGSEGVITSLSGGLTLSGPVFVPHENGTIETFDDKFALLLGGRAGLFTVDGEEVCVRDDGCRTDPQIETQQVRPSNITRCDAEFCTAKSSFQQSSFARFFGYCSRGATTTQTAGGYQEDTHWCRKWGFIPWRCTTKRGTNRLTLEVAFLGSPLGNRFRSGDRRDVESLTTKIWSWPIGDAFECTVPTVCASHTSTGNSTSRTGPDNRSTFAQTGVSCEDRPIIIE